MKITNVKVRGLKPLEHKLRWNETYSPTEIRNDVVTVQTDEGIEGHLVTWTDSTGLVKKALPAIKSLLVGRDPWDIEAIWYQTQQLGRGLNTVCSTIDICLWDILAKKVGVPLYKLLGAYRDKILAYASTVTHATDQEFVDEALNCRAEGFTAYKLHAYGIPDKDIRVCRAVREAVGDTMELMLDPVNVYDRRGAFRVGRVLEELDFYWFEAPIPDTDLDGLIDLTRALDIQITATESVFQGLKFLPRYLTNHACDSLRMVGDMAGGITALRKAAHLCEAFDVKFEPHSYGSTLVQAAHLHVHLAMRNCDFVEIPVPQGIFDIGMKDVIRVAKDGYVYAPTKPGLGYDIDWEAVEQLTVEEL